MDLSFSMKWRVPDFPKIASSDLHVARQMTSWKTVLDCERHPEAILDAIRKQKLSFSFYEDRGQRSHDATLASNFAPVAGLGKPRSPAVVWGTWYTLRQLRKSPAPLATFTAGLDPETAEGRGARFRREHRFVFFVSIIPSTSSSFPSRRATIPLAGAVEALMARYPNAAARLIIGSVNIGPNPKVNNLVSAVRPGGLRLRAHQRQQCSCRARLPDESRAAADSRRRRRGPRWSRATRAKGPGGLLETTFLNSFYARLDADRAASLGSSFVVGKSMLFRRSGGESFRRHPSAWHVHRGRLSDGPRDEPAGTARRDNVRSDSAVRRLPHARSVFGRGICAGGASENPKRRSRFFVERVIRTHSFRPARRVRVQSTDRPEPDGISRGAFFFLDGDGSPPDGCARRRHRRKIRDRMDR